MYEPAVHGSDYSVYGLCTVHFPFNKNTKKLKDIYILRYILISGFAALAKFR